MCGIAGFYNRSGRPADPQILRDMASEMNRRGPDGEGFFTDGPCGLAHKRLSIIDLSSGGQPIFNEDRTVAMVTNGEIYNYRDLRRMLEGKGHRFRTNSDSECIVHLYEEYGTDFPAHLQGMFAIAVADVPKRKLLLVTDRAGKKPVFYFSSGKTFAFASTLRALKMHPEMPSELNEQGILDYFTFLYIPAPDTLYRNVRKLRAGRILTLSPEMEYPDIQTWWKPDYAVKTTRSREEECRLLRENVLRAVTDRLNADVPLGVFLSGGLDSTIVAACAAAQKSDLPLECFSIGFGEKAYDESEQAQINAEYIRSRAARPVHFHLKTVRADDFSVLRMLCREYGEPFADASVLPTHLLASFARQNVTVALSGDGADELFGGYERYLAIRMLSRLDVLPGLIRKLVFSFPALFLPAWTGERSISARMRRFLQAAGAGCDDRYLSILSKCPARWGRLLPGPAFREVIAQKPDRFFSGIRRHSMVTDPADRVMEYDFHTYLFNDILPKADTASMAASLEVRSPFLDTAVMEQAFAMPSAWKLDGMRRKAILGDAFAGWYPSGLDRMKKRGFGLPMAQWMRGVWRNHLEHALLDGVAVTKYGLFHRKTLEKMIRSHVSRREDLSYLLFSVLVLELTLENSPERGKL